MTGISGTRVNKFSVTSGLICLWILIDVALVRFTGEWIVSLVFAVLLYMSVLENFRLSDELHKLREKHNEVRYSED